MKPHKQLTGQGGKGSADRTGDQAKFNASFDRIFGKPKKVKDSGT